MSWVCRKIEPASMAHPLCHAYSPTLYYGRPPSCWGAALAVRAQPSARREILNEYARLTVSVHGTRHAAARPCPLRLIGCICRRPPIGTGFGSLKRDTRQGVTQEDT